MDPQGDDESLKVLAQNKIFEWAERCVKRLRNAAEAEPAGQIAIRFGRALETVRSIELGVLPEAAFDIDEATGRLILSVSPLVRIFDQIANDLSNDQAKPGSARLSYDQYMRFCELVVAVYVFHELRHIDQRISDFADVQRLKALGLHSLLAELDLLADRDAVAAFADVYFDDEFVGDWQEAFAVGLSFSPQYFFQAFSFEKPHKALRAACICLMAARILVFEEAEGAIPSVPLDSAIVVRGLEKLAGSSDDKSFALVAEQPTKTIYQIGDDDWSASLGEMLVAVENNDFDRAIAVAMEIVRKKELEKPETRL